MSHVRGNGSDALEHLRLLEEQTAYFKELHANNEQQAHDLAELRDLRTFEAIAIQPRARSDIYSNSCSIYSR